VGINEVKKNIQFRVTATHFSDIRSNVELINQPINPKSNFGYTPWLLDFPAETSFLVTTSLLTATTAVSPDRFLPWINYLSIKQP